MFTLKNAMFKSDVFAPVLPRLIAMNGTIRPLYNDPEIVNVQKLNEFLEAKDHLKKHIGNEFFIVLKFLLNENHKLIFGRSGAPFGTVPTHYQMTGESDPFSARCISAGEAFFGKDKKLYVINHLSPDFHPSFDSLQFVIRALLTENIAMADEIVVQRVRRSGAFDAAYRVRLVGDEVKTADFPQSPLTAPLVHQSRAWMDRDMREEAYEMPPTHTVFSQKKYQI